MALETVENRVVSLQDSKFFQKTNFDPRIQVAMGAEAMPPQLFGAVRNVSECAFTANENFINFGEVVTGLAIPIYFGAGEDNPADSAIRWAESPERRAHMPRLYEVGYRAATLVRDYREDEGDVLEDLGAFYLMHFNGGSEYHGVTSVDPAIQRAVYRRGVSREILRAANRHQLLNERGFNTGFPIDTELDAWRAAQAAGGESVVGVSPYDYFESSLSQRAAMFALGGIYNAKIPACFETRSVGKTLQSEKAA